MKPIVKATLLSLVILLMLACGLVPESTKEPEIKLDREQEYYLGAYQGCAWVILVFLPQLPIGEFCKSMVQYMMVDDLYRNKNLPKSWEWPLPTLTPTPTLVPAPAATLSVGTMSKRGD